MILAIFVLALFIAILVFVMLLSDDCSDAQFASAMGIIICILAITILTCVIESKLRTEPKAIDVYRNKTTLQITYQDSIPIDTIIVFK